MDEVLQAGRAARLELSLRESGWTRVDRIEDNRVIVAQAWTTALSVDSGEVVDDSAHVVANIAVPLVDGVEPVMLVAVIREGGEPKMYSLTEVVSPAQIVTASIE